MNLFSYIWLPFLILYKSISSLPYQTFSTDSSNLIWGSTNPMNSICTCDISVGICDIYCCCDPDCQPLGITFLNWSVNGQCAPTAQNDYDKYFENCRDSFYSASLSDLYSPIRVFYRNWIGGFCISTNNGNFNKTILSNYTINNTTDFTNLISKYKNVSDINTSTFLYNSNTFNNNIPILYEQNSFLLANFTKYSPLDILIIKKNLNSNYETYKIPITSPYGKCKNNLDTIRYMKNKNNICSYKMIYNIDSCTNFNFRNFNSSSINSLFGNSTNIIQPVIKAYKITDKLYYTRLVDNTLITTPGINVFTGVNSAGRCKCSNIITKIEYHFSMLNETIIGHEIDYFIEDLSNDCTVIENVPINYLVFFEGYNTTFNYTKSGNPGYIKGKPLLTATSSSLTVNINATGLNTTYNYVDQYLKERLIFGVGLKTENRGLCYYTKPLSGVDEGINTTLSLNNSIIANYSGALIPFFDITSIPSTNEFGLYKSPIFEQSLTYEDSISWGCADKLNITGLQYYCNNQLWKQKLLYQIVKNLTYISKFGNPNHHLTQDWVKIDALNFDSFTSVWDTDQNKCYIPAVLNVDILYATFGMTNNTQQSIYIVKFRMDYVYWWGKNIFNKSIKDSYPSQVNINYYRIPQDTVWWYAPGPGFIKLPKNILYPFRIGTTQYGTTTSGDFVKINFFKFFIFIIIFLF